jgi:signal transduction histidine kinase
MSSVPAEPVTILLVDDQPAKLLSYEVMLSGLGERLMQANSGTEALNILLRHDIAVILIDVCMPDLDGFQLASMIREHPRFEKIAIIFVSAVQIAELDLVHGYEMGAVDYVPVPVVPELLRAKIRVFADLYRKTSQLERANEALEARVAERTVELERMNAELELRIQDRTRERETALAQVHQMQKLESLGKLTGGVAHDFNNLLTVVIANLDLLRMALADEPRLARLIDGAAAGAQRGVLLTRRMLAFARRQELKPEAVELPKLVEGMAELLRHSLGPMVAVETRFSADLRPAQADPSQLELALLNLALNARDAMPAGGQILISGRCGQPDRTVAGALLPGSYVLLEISDAGTGMDERILARATEPFFTTKEVGQGTGLGLSMVQGFVAQSGGAMQIESVVGEGTTVRLWLPLAELPAEDAPPASLSAPSEGGRLYRVLLVDDDPMVRDVTLNMLLDLGHDAVAASSALEALDMLGEQRKFDLVITDHAMPGMTGSELARAIRLRWQGMRVLLISGYAMLPSGEDADLPRLSKPYRRKELSASIFEVMEGGGRAEGLALSKADRTR